MKRRSFLRYMGIGAIGAAGAGCTGASLFNHSGTERPNILFIFSDDHSLQTLGAYKARMQNFIKKHNITPNIDKLAEEGMLFENSFVCNSICGPSRAAILTGKHSHINGFMENGNRFDSSQWTAPKELQKGGYQTAVIGKWHLGTRPTGFDHYDVLPGQGAYYNPDFITKGRDKKIRKQGYCTDIIGDMTTEWLDKKWDKSKPFFLCSWHKAPHRTWMPHPRHFEFLDGLEIPEPENLFDDYEGRTKAAKMQEMTIKDHINIASDLKVTPPVAKTPVSRIREKAPKSKSMDPATFGEFNRMNDEQKKAWDSYYVPRNEEFRSQNLSGKELVRWKYQQYLKDYIKCIKALDENVGKVLDYLKAKGLEKNTMVIYSSDQGFYNGEHGWYDKRWIYEESLRNPLIIKWPGSVRQGSRCSEMVQNIDYAPTLLHAAGMKVPQEVQGRSLMPLLKNKTPNDWRESILYTYYGKDAHAVVSHWGVRTERYKLIEFFPLGEWEFYDLKKDPLEMQSEYNNPDYQNVIAALKKEMERLFAQYKLNPAPRRKKYSG
ncbi:sulfatase [Sedimentisphaera salicampi]|uniref:Arylsulfatase n=1 Tax=Sedimentisphaera salicampi TaxID=1941349 RepID=A0A1W6LK82_9BACT|nr:sulfatase [Sedimentisphaera salicampi]ARN56187.1 Arylsulfatase [Sedimentisphaera salicampi]